MNPELGRLWRVGFARAYLLAGAALVALAVGMILITGLANVIYLIISSRAERWLK
jgi:ABC-type uncharacterized transport system permease subunit